MNNFIANILYRYENLSPRRKAQADMLGILFTCFICSGILAIMIHFNLVLEFAIFMLCYGVFGMVRILYKSRVSYYELQEKLKK